MLLREDQEHYSLSSTGTSIITLPKAMHCVPLPSDKNAIQFYQKPRFFLCALCLLRVPP